MYMSSCILGIFPVEGKEVPEHWAPAVIPRRGAEASVTRVFSGEAPMDVQNKQDTIPVPKLIIFLIGTKSMEVVVTSKYDLMTIKWVQRTKPTQQIFCI